MDYIRVIERICEYRGVSVEDVMGRFGNSNVYITRYFVYAYLHNKMKIPGEVMATIFNRRRINILLGIRTLKNNIQYNRELQKEWNKVVEMLESEQ